MNTATHNAEHVEPGDVECPCTTGGACFGCEGGPPSVKHDITDEVESEPAVDEYGNPVDGSSLPFCCFPDCGCDGARLCMAESGANDAACALNVERGSKPTGWLI